MPILVFLVLFLLLWIIVNIGKALQRASNAKAEHEALQVRNQNAANEKNRRERLFQDNMGRVKAHFNAEVQKLIASGQIDENISLVDMAHRTQQEMEQATEWLDSQIVVCDQGHRHTHGNFVVSMGTEIETTIHERSQTTHSSGHSTIHRTNRHGFSAPGGYSDSTGQAISDVYVPETTGSVVLQRRCPTCGTDICQFALNMRECIHQTLPTKTPVVLSEHRKVCLGISDYFRSYVYDRWDDGYPRYHIYSAELLQCPMCLLENSANADAVALNRGKLPSYLSSGS